MARLRRLGILGEVDLASGRPIVWSEDFRTVVGGGRDVERRRRLQEAMASDDPPTVKAFLAEEAARVLAELEAAHGPRRQPPRPAPEELFAHTLMGPPESFVLREMAVLDYLREVGIVGAVEVDPATAAIRVELSEPYRRLVAAGREPDREPGFDAAWEAGGPGGVRTWLEDEARKLSSVDGSEADLPSKATDDQSGSGTSVPDLVKQVGGRALRDLIDEVCGGQADPFLSTPRRALGGRTPLEALQDGDMDAVWQIVLTDLEGNWQ